MQQTAVVALITGILTATVALMASWLTSRATISAARVNVTSNAQTQRRERARDLRRTAYVDLLTYVAEVRWRVRDLIHRAGAGDETALIDFRSGRNVVGGELARRRYVVYLEGPESIRQPVERLQAAFDRLGDDLDRALQLHDPDEIRAEARESRDALSRETQNFIVQAQAALTDTMTEAL
jgi:hypothetical protein